MNIPASYTLRTVNFQRSNRAGRFQGRAGLPAAVACEDDPLAKPIEDVTAAVDEVLVRLRRNPSYGLQKHILDHARVCDERKLQYEVRLVNGRRIIILVGTNKRRLNRTWARVRRQRRDFTDKVLITVGEAIGNVLSKIANCIRSICYILEADPDPECDRKRFQAREKKCKWSAPKNFQPVFC